MGAPSSDINVFMAEIDRISAVDPRLNALSAAILAGLAFDIAHDSRSFAKALGIEHALVLREVQALLDLECLTITKRDERTQRCSYAAITASDLRSVAGNDNI